MNAKHNLLKTKEHQVNIVRENTISLQSKTSTSRFHTKNLKNKWQLYLLLLPALVYIVIFAYGPMYGIQIAFKNYRTGLGIWKSEWVGFQHFVRFMTYQNFWKILFNTLSLSLYGLATFPCAVIFALLLNEVDNRSYKKSVQLLSYMPHFFSTVVVCGIILLFLDRSSGVINKVLEMIGIQRIAFLSNPRLFPSIYVWSGTWQNLGWNSIIYLAALSSVSPEMIEAARIDGANRIQIIWHVNLPTILPTVVTMLILSCGTLLSVGFEKVYLLQNSLNLDASEIISTYTYQIGLLGGQFSYSSAIGLFNTVVNVTLLAIVNTISKRLSGTGIW